MVFSPEQAPMSPQQLEMPMNLEEHFDSCNLKVKNFCLPHQTKSSSKPMSSRQPANSKSKPKPSTKPVKDDPGWGFDGDNWGVEEDSGWGDNDSWGQDEGESQDVNTKECCDTLLRTVSRILFKRYMFVL